MAKYKALLIDDNTQFTESVKGYLLSQDRFSEVDTAQDGREALKKLREKTYDVMTLDLIMPCSTTCTTSSRTGTGISPTAWSGSCAFPSSSTSGPGPGSCP